MPRQARDKHRNTGKVETKLCFLQRVPLDELCLQIKLLDLGDVAEFLGRAIEPPRVEAVTVKHNGAKQS